MKAAVVVLVAAFAASLSACGNSGSDASGPLSLPSGELDSMVILDISAGAGEPIEAGDTAVVHYTGWLYDASAPDRRGNRFDSSGDEPFEFPLGEGRVIDGWEVGVEGMRAGGRRYLFIPPSLAYGARALDGIPANSTLFFDVGLVEIR